MQCSKCGSRRFEPRKCEITDEKGQHHVTFKAIWVCEVCLEPFVDEKTVLEYLRKYKVNG